MIPPDAAARRGRRRSQEDIVNVDASVDPPGLNVEATSAWLAGHVPEMRPPLTFGLIAAGGSNLTYRIDDAEGRKWILRRPPAAAVLASAHDVAREHRIMAALRDTDVPVPEMRAFCPDPDITGAPFYVMSYAEGLILRRQESATEIGADNCRRAAVAFFETLARIHTLDTTGAGLEDLSRAGGYVQRQLRRWLAQYNASLRRDPNPLVLELHARMAAKPPADISPEGLLVHGDYHIDNAVLDPEMSVIAVLDWELATLGHPIADLCWALMFWARPGDPIVMMEEAVTAAPGFPDRGEMAAVYENASGYPLDNISYFQAFALWKLSCLIQGSLFRAEEGGRGGMQHGREVDPSQTLGRIQAMLERANDFAHAARI
jgi:aminoglycoside phosphotransferase (APT) family kinase protein